MPSKCFHEKRLSPNEFSLASEISPFFVVLDTDIPVCDGEPIRLSETNPLDGTPTGSFIIRVVSKAVQVNITVPKPPPIKTYVLTCERI